MSQNLSEEVFRLKIADTLNKRIAIAVKTAPAMKQIKTEPGCVYDHSPFGNKDQQLKNSKYSYVIR